MNSRNGQAAEPQNGTAALKAGLSETDKPQRLADYLEIFLENLAFIVRFVAVAMGVAVIALVSLPKTFTARAVLMPPEDPNKQSLLTQLGSATGLGALGGMSSASVSELLVEILRSRSLAESLVVREQLAEVFQEKTLERNTEALRNASRYTAQKQGFITIDVSMSTPYFAFLTGDIDTARARAARIAAAYIQALDDINRERTNAKSRAAARYFADQLIDIKAGVDSAYSALERFQKKNKALSLPDQFRGQLQAAGELKARLIAEQMNLDLLLRDRQPDDVFVTQARNRVSEMQTQYSRLSGGSTDEFALRFSEFPALAREYASLFREVKTQEELYAVVRQFYLKERLQGSRDTPTVTVLDMPQLPERHSSPRYLTVLAVTLVGSVIAAMGAVFFRRFLRRTQADSERYGRVWALIRANPAVRLWRRRPSEIDLK